VVEQAVRRLAINSIGRTDLIRIAPPISQSKYRSNV
jgi:hypothetical protein